jgi:hypothetical protein
VSSIGRGGVNQRIFVAAMKSEHGTDFAQIPCLFEFLPDLTETNDKGEIEIYGYGKAKREGSLFPLSLQLYIIPSLSCFENRPRIIGTN